MARRNLFLGNARGKVGDIVMYRRNGKQVSRIYVIPANPKSEAQCRTRMAFATCTSAAALLKPIVNHSWENVKKGEASVNHFSKVNMPRVRAAAWNGIIVSDGVTEFDYANFLIKGAKGCAPFPFQVSRGSLMWKAYEIGDGFVGVKGVGSDLLTLEITGPESYRQALAALGVAPGEQLSIVLVCRQVGDGQAIVQARYGDAVNYNTSLELCRVVFKREDEVSFLDPFYLVQAGSFASQAVNFVKTSNWVRNIVIDDTEFASGLLRFNWEDSLAENLEGFGVAVIRSSYDRATAKWKYSTALMSWFAANNLSTKDEVWQSYGKAVREGSSDLYLQQADNMDASAPSDAPLAPPAVTISAEPSLPQRSTASSISVSLTLPSGMVWDDETFRKLRVVVNGEVAELSLSTSAAYTALGSTFEISRAESSNVTTGSLSAGAVLNSITYLG